MPVTVDVGESVEPKGIVGLKRILLATDFSDASERALYYALALAHRYDSEIFVVHAVQPEAREAVPLDPLPRELDAEWVKADRQMEQTAKSVTFDGVQHKEIVRRGEVLDVVSRVMHEEGCDLLVTGTHGRRGLAKLALGSIAEQMLHLETCPVLTVGPCVPAIPKSGIQISKVLFATDFGPASTKALPYATAFAKEFRARLVLLHMIEPMPVAEITPAAYGPPAYAAEEFSKWQLARKRESQARLRKLVEFDGLVPSPTFEVGMDLVPAGILETARHSEANLIVMGVNHKESPRLASHFPWALTSEVVRKAKCPVLTVCG
jgi:nucleotide-binding universal stress UspA family protein